MKTNLTPHATRVVFFAPGVLLILAALCALLAPRLVLAAVAGFFLFFGFLLCIGAYKLLSFKKKFEAMAQELRKGTGPGAVAQGRVVVQRFHVGQAPASPEYIEATEEFSDESDSQHGGRKIILH